MGGPRQFSADRLCQLILDQAAGPLAILDLQGRYIHVNPAGCRLIGYALEELLGHVPREFTFPDDDALDREAIDRVIQGRDDSYEVEKRFLGSDGHVVWALVTNSLIRDDDGRPLFFLSQVQDITVRREFERRWQQTVSNAPVGMALIDLGRVAKSIGGLRRYGSRPRMSRPSCRTAM
ncbi:PAS domain S-box protein, partial [Saccharopolyspora cebuensis]